MGIKCFFLVPIQDLYEFSLRRYTYSSVKKCVNSDYGHDASTGCLWKGSASDPVLPEAARREGEACRGDSWPHDDQRWPTMCKCGYVFQADDHWQFVPEQVFRRHDTGEEITLYSAPTGAMWFADWMGQYHAGFDGHTLAVRLPGRHDWMPESRANNCDSPCKHCNKPYNQHLNAQGQKSGRCQPTWTYGDGNSHYEDSRPHKCWVRHGTPPNEIVHVDKNGVTCGAGAGSIAIDGWHGFLHNGELVG